jgi:hypothetical protein
VKTSNLIKVKLFLFSTKGYRMKTNGGVWVDEYSVVIATGY